MIDSTYTIEFEGGELRRALERFDWLAEQVRDRVHDARAGELQCVLQDVRSRVSAKERALVMLGLLATARAHAALAWFDSAGEHRRVRLLHRLAKRECARRRRSSEVGRAPAPNRRRTA